MNKSSKNMFFATKSLYILEAPSIYNVYGRQQFVSQFLQINTVFIIIATFDL